MAKPKNETPAPAETGDDAGARKGRPTPTRAEREAANRRPLVANDRKEARSRMNAERDRQRVGMANGEERYLPPRDKGPQKRFVRDTVDARFSIGEILLPLMFLVIFATFLPDQRVATYALLGVWAFILLAVLDCVILGQRLTKQLRDKYGDKAEKVRWYAAMRALQLRPLRLPKPQVKRGQHPTL
ncbi:DUF3043 domain-containing protein [Homoserinibacter sp. YIM 151385]|uniref:DUF3043 domain-containing protein n=1 Tax=Homoserinibacter sp. YIM 151385 TaxID=2985506 RepID=UPI0022EFEDB7|nr:DUF3043 domain-containing protein [Homoserinibacter sp. YIM 151385]WBU38725.1 DUF3043 domain-containing protein [Homoserinibacter sp. YIM 151385]